MHARLLDTLAVAAVVCCSASLSCAKHSAVHEQGAEGSVTCFTTFVCVLAIRTHIGHHRICYLFHHICVCVCVCVL